MGRSNQERRRIREEQQRRYADVPASHIGAEAPKTEQLGLGLELGKGRCQLCGRAIERRCKWCSKGGTGDPPCPEMKAYATWTNGLRKQVRKRLEHASLPSHTIEQSIAALFDGVGHVPDDAIVHVQDLLHGARFVSEKSYNQARQWAIMHHHIYVALYDEHCRPVDPYYQPLEEKMAKYKGKTGDEIVEMQNEAQARLTAAVERIRVIAALSVLLVEKGRAAGISKEQRSIAQFVQMATATYDDFRFATAADWTRQAIMAQAHRVITEEVGRLSRTEPIDDALYEKALAAADAVPVDEAWPEGWARVAERHINPGGDVFEMVDLRAALACDAR